MLSQISDFYGPAYSVQGPFVFAQDKSCWHTFCQKNLEHFQQTLKHRKYRILADLDSGPKAESWSPTTRPS